MNEPSFKLYAVLCGCRTIVAMPPKMKTALGGEFFLKPQQRALLTYFHKAHADAHDLQITLWQFTHECSNKFFT